MNRFPASLKARSLQPWNDPKWDVFKEVEPDARSIPSVAGWFQMQTVIIAALQLTGTSLRAVFNNVGSVLSNSAGSN